jgi:hypothetical protein
MTTTRQEARPMLLVDCPLCDQAAPFDPEEDELECPACAIRLQVAAEPPVGLPAAA